jgi:phosphoribosyl-ATP pyrophosphohydrolase
MSKSFEELFSELKAKAAAADPESGTVKELARGTHFIGKKIVEVAGEVWIASEYEGKERTAEEISQLIYHLQVMMIDRKLELEDIYRYL